MGGMFSQETTTGSAQDLYQSSWWVRLETITRDAERRESRPVLPVLIEPTRDAGRSREHEKRGFRLDRRWPLFLVKGMRVIAHALGTQ